MKHLIVTLCLLVGVLLTADAQLTGEIVYRHPEYVDELWVASLEAPNTARLFFKHTQGIAEVAAENRGTRIVIVDESDAPDFSANVYLIDTAHPEKRAINLTHNRFERVSDVDIDAKGNVLFTNAIVEGEPPPKEPGVYFIAVEELDKPEPDIEVLQRAAAHRVVGLPSGKAVAYDTDVGVFLYDRSTQETQRLCRYVLFPAVSSDGELIAFAYLSSWTGTSASEIEVVRLEMMRERQIVDPIAHANFIDLKFSPDGAYVVYTIYGGHFFFPNTITQTLAVPLDGGPAFNTLEIHAEGIAKFDWWNVSYAVEPAKKVATLWGQLKAGNR